MTYMKIWEINSNELFAPLGYEKEFKKRILQEKHVDKYDLIMSMPLPYELKSVIMYNNKGIMTPTAKIINDLVAGKYDEDYILTKGLCKQNIDWGNSVFGFTYDEYYLNMTIKIKEQGGSIARGDGTYIKYWVDKPVYMPRRIIGFYSNFLYEDYETVENNSFIDSLRDIRHNAYRNEPVYDKYKKLQVKNWKVKELKEYLDMNEIKYKKSLKKKDLIRLCYKF